MGVEIICVRSCGNRVLLFCIAIYFYVYSFFQIIFTNSAEIDANIVFAEVVEYI